MRNGTHDGRVLAVLRSTHVAGWINFTVTAPGPGYLIVSLVASS